MVILDTNIVIDHLRQPSDTPSYFYQMMNKNPNEKLAISIISVQELYEGKSTRNEKQEQILLTIISHLNIIPYSYEVAKLAGIIARDLKRPIELADSAIAATALVHGADLLTLNKKDFVDIKDLRLVSGNP